MSTPPSSRSWPVSTYDLSTSRRHGDQIHIDHPNDLGTTPASGASSERARLARFRALYIDRSMHAAATRPGVRHSLFRRFSPEPFLAQCRAKSCFHRDALADAPATLVSAQAPVLNDTRRDSGGDGVKHFVARARAAAAETEDLYGAAVAADIRLGFSRAFGLDAPAAMPSVVEACSAEDDAMSVGGDEDTLFIVISYRHTTAKLGRILNIDAARWPRVRDSIHRLCKTAGVRRFRVWTDQILSSRKPVGDLRWVSSGVLPYAVYPVLYIAREVGEGGGGSGVVDGHDDAGTAGEAANAAVQASVSDDLQRMWIAVEHFAASLGQGVIHVGDALGDDALPPEWPTTYITVAQQGGGVAAETWMIGLGVAGHGVVRRVAGAVMCGLARVKDVSWVSDAHDLIDWASTISSSFLFRDLVHSFDCADCKMPLGYTSGHRIMALISSCAPYSPALLGAGTGAEQFLPRLNLPAVSLRINSRSWDGFREWIPESCLWGTEADERKITRSLVTSNTQALLFSDGSLRALVVLQFKMLREGGESAVLAYLLVGVSNLVASRLHGDVNWSKRFWPSDPGRMVAAFGKIVLNTADKKAVQDLAYIVGASSGIDYNDICSAPLIQVLDMKCVRWGERAN